MKHLRVIFSLFLLVSCGQEKVEYEDLVKKEGLYYYKFSEKKFTGEFKKGQYQGKVKYGKKEGRWLHYDDDGSLRSEINYKNNKREGKLFSYNWNGELYKTEIYKDGKLIETIKP